MQIDHILDNYYEDVITGGDFAIGDADEDNVQLLLTFNKGHIRHAPLVGLGIDRYINGSITFKEKSDILSTLINDGYSVNLLTVDPTDGEIIIDFQ